MQKQWEIGAPDAQVVAQLMREGGVTKLCAEVLAARGMQTVQTASAFLDAQELSDPFLLRDMQAAVDRILQAIARGERICVYGDYDCDGVTATVMLYDWLLSAGADACWYIPTRKEGYGMRKEALETLANDGVRLIVTVDNGISAIAEAAVIQTLGMELVVTDHHRPGDVLPEAVAVVDPYRVDCPSPYKSLCGAGVVLKLIAALDGGDWQPALEQFGDLAALATIADVVTLDGENRFLVKRGLELLPNTERMGLLSLMAVCGIGDGDPVTTGMASFQLIPRINAAGRFGSAATAARLFLTDDPEEAQLLAAELHSLNDSRRETEQIILREITEMIQDTPALLYARVLVFAGEHWHHGVIGIVAARLMERYGKPCFLLSREDDGYRGSARSFGAFSVFDCLHDCAPLLERYGGHPGAGGFTVSATQLAAFQAAIQQYAADRHTTMPVMTLHAERAIAPSDLTIANVDGLNLLEPYGAGNARPLFVLSGMTIRERIALSGGLHTKLRLRKEDSTVDALLFRVSPEQSGLPVGMTVDLLVALEVRPYQGRPSLSVRIEDWRQSKALQTQAIAAQAAYEAYQRQEPLPEAYYQRMCPQRADLIAVYQLVASPEAIPVASIAATLRGQGMNLCRARMCVDILTELDLLCWDAAADTVWRVPAIKKQSLADSTRYQAILRLAGQSIA